MAIVDVRAKDADEAVAAAWSAYGTHKDWPLKIQTESPGRGGWSDVYTYTYQTSPDEQPSVIAVAHSVGGVWNIVISAVADATSEKRLG